MAKKNPTTLQIEAYLEKHPNAETRDIHKALNVPKDTISKVKYNLRTKPQSKAKDKQVLSDICPNRTGELLITLPHDGMLVKVRNGHGMIGTLMLTNQGLTYKTANSKADPERTLRWDVLDNLMKSGLLG